MKRVFMRAYWGIEDTSNRILARKQRVKKNISMISKSKIKFPFITYVFGKENYEALTSLGYKCVLLCNEPFAYDLVKYQYRHKLEAIRYAFEVDGYDEMIHLDWDCVPKRHVDGEIWDILSKKEAFQANLQIYHRRRATWRKKDIRKIPNGGFIYIRNKNYPSEIIKIWETMPGPSAEPALAKFVDNLMGGWNGIDKYWDLFEPMCCNLHKASAYPKEILEKKKNDVHFLHYQGGT